MLAIASNFRAWPGRTVGQARISNFVFFAGRPSRSCGAFEQEAFEARRGSARGPITRNASAGKSRIIAPPQTGRDRFLVQNAMHLNDL